MAISVRELADGHRKRLAAALGDDISPMQQSAIERAAELLALATSMRGNAVDGGTVDLGELVRIEDMADLAVSKLGIPATPLRKPEALTVKFVGPDHERLRRLSDEELNQLEAIASRLYGDAPDESAPAGAPECDDERSHQISELLLLNKQLNDMVIEANRLRSIAEQSEQTQKRLCDSALARCAELEAAAPATPRPEIAQQRPPQGQQEASNKPSNVVDIRGNGSAVVNGTLGERYPNLAHDPPVGRW